jgi:hypothetical protein
MKKTSPQFLLTDQFKQFINASSSGRRLTPSGKRVSKGTIVNYLYVYRLLQEFETISGSRLRIQLLHRASMRTLQREKNYWNRFFVKFSDFLYKDKGYYDNYVANIYKEIRTFFNYLQKGKGFVIGNYHKSFKVPVQQPTPIVLLPDQLNFLITNKEFESALTKPLERAKDICVFGCTVGLRYEVVRITRTQNSLGLNNNNTFFHRYQDFDN